LGQLKKTMIPLGELFAQFEKADAGVRLLLVDACRHEPSGARSLDDLPRPARGVAVLFSCKGGERAFETRKLGKGHGVFFYYAIQALKGEAVNDSGEAPGQRLVAHVNRNVSDQVPILIGGRARQTPHELKNVEGKSVVLLSRETSEGERFYRHGLDLLLGIREDGDAGRAFELFDKAQKK